jgi:hypothetical protein
MLGDVHSDGPCRSGIFYQGQFLVSGLGGGLFEVGLCDRIEEFWDSYKPGVEKFR